jgi:site-specific DNA recombinase
VLNTNFNTSSVPQTNPGSFIEKIRESEHSRLVDVNYLELLNQPYSVRVALYLRVSTLRQAEKNKVSLPEQKAAIMQMIKSHSDWNIVATYNEGGSSGKEMETREEFEKMTGDALQGKFDLIVGWSTDRMARNFEQMTAYRKQMRLCGVQVTSVMEPAPIIDPRTLSRNFKSQDKIMNAILDWKAEADNETRVARFNLGKMGKAKRGVNPCKVPYGFRKKITYENEDPDKKREVDVVIEKEAVIVREIFEIYDQKNWGFRKIADYLSHTGLPSPKRRLWGYSTIKYILQNPTYTGLVRWGWRLSESKRSRTRLRQGHEGIIVQGKHDPIIDPELFQRIQDKMAIRAKLGGRAVASRGLLSGLIFCGRCHGHGYLWSSKITNKHPGGAAYLCSNYAQHGTSACSQRYIISKVKAEEAVIQKIKELASNPEAQEEFVKQSRSSKKDDIKARIKLIQGSFDQIKENRERIKKLLITQDFDPKMISDFKDELTKYDLQEISQTKELENLQTELTKESQTEKMTKETILSLMDFDTIWESAELDRKKMLLATLIKKVVISDDKDIYIEFNHQ